MSQGWETVLEEELVRPGRLVILGVGNAEKGDDAAGSLCLALIRSNFHGVRPDLLVIQGGTVPENETGRIREFQPSHILVIDAALGNLPPGTVFIVDPRTIGRDDLSTHHLPLSLLVQYFEVSLDCRVICLGIQPESVEMGRPVSEPVKRAIALVAERIVDILVRRPVPALT